MSYTEYMDRLEDILDEYYKSEWYEDLELRTEAMIKELNKEYNNV